jgi:hypothetical protein
MLTETQRLAERLGQKAVKEIKEIKEIGEGRAGGQ